MPFFSNLYGGPRPCARSKRGRLDAPKNGGWGRFDYTLIRRFATISLARKGLRVLSSRSLTPVRMVFMKKKLERNEGGEARVGRRLRRRPASEYDRDPVPDFMVLDAEADRSKSKITADDCAWLGEDGKLDPDKLLKKRGYEPDGALRLILGAIVDAHRWLTVQLALSESIRRKRSY